MLVTKKGLEPPRLSASDPKSDVSANSTTRPLVPPLRAARSFSDFQSGPITGFGLRGKRQDTFGFKKKLNGLKLLYVSFS